MAAVDRGTSLGPKRDDPRAVLEWYDFVCPFCYVGQARSAILARCGLHVTELPFQAHPEIPPGGIRAGPREGPMYASLEREARGAGLPLNWPPRIPNSRRALAAAEWVRRHQARAFAGLRAALFAAHFVLGEDLDDLAVLDRHVGEAGVDLGGLHAALSDGAAETTVRSAEAIGRERGVRGTPTWLIAGQLIGGLLPAAAFERLGADAAAI